MNRTITHETIIEHLILRGYKASLRQVNKNGIVYYGVVIANPDNRHIAPCIYLNDFINFDGNLDEIVDKILKIYNSHKDYDFDITLLSNREWIIEHMYIGLQRKSYNELIKRECGFEGLEQYLYLKGDENEELWHIKLNDCILSLCDIAENEAWEYAKKNTFSGNTKITRIGCYLKEVSSCAEFDGIDDMMPLYVITNKNGNMGSIQIFDRESIDKWIASLNIRPKIILCIPSSIHEWIMVPLVDKPSDEDIQFYNSMINQVNSDMSGTDILSDHVFFMYC